MRFFRRSRALLRTGLLATGLLVAAGSGCQIGPNYPPAPMPFYPKEMLEFFPSKPPAEYSLSEDAAAMKPDPTDRAARNK